MEDYDRTTYHVASYYDARLTSQDTALTMKNVWEVDARVNRYKAVEILRSKFLFSSPKHPYQIQT